MITVSYNAYCAITKEGDNDIWTVRPRGVVPLLPLCSQIDAGATVNALLGDTFSRENNTHGSRFHDRDPQFASRILGAMTQSCYIGTRDIQSRVIRGLYCMLFFEMKYWKLMIATWKLPTSKVYHGLNNALGMCVHKKHYQVLPTQMVPISALAHGLSQLLFALSHRHHVSWWPGSLRGQGISSSDIGCTG